MDEQRLKYFEQLLLKEKESDKKLAKNLEEDFNGNLREQSGDLSAYDTHPADMGTDMFQMAQNNRFIENEAERIRQIDEALQRIRNKTYGKCRICGGDIPEERLEIIPFAQLCIECEKDDYPLDYKLKTRPVEENVIGSTIKF